MMTPETFRAIVSGQLRGVGPTATRAALRVVSVPYGLVMRARNAWYDQSVLTATHGVGVPVVSVGNLTLGGTGKTPFVSWLSQWFQSTGIKVGLVSRGYGARDGGPNDEARELAMRLPNVPHVQNSDRVAAARQAIAQHDAQLILLDDAFQHRRIARDLDIVLIDATEPFGLQRLFPSGYLREPTSSLRRADVVVLTRSNLVDAEARSIIHDHVHEMAPDAIWVEIAQRAAGLLDRNAKLQTLDALATDEPIVAFCGIGNPHAFRKLLEDQGYRVLGLREFPDHFDYDRESLADLDQWLTQFSQASAVVCTHKDWVKLPADSIENLPLWAVTLDLVFEVGKEALEERLRELASTAKAGSGGHS